MKCKRIYQRIWIAVFMLIGQHNTLFARGTDLYPANNDRKHSPGKTTYYIDPQQGSDYNRGTSIKKPWKTFRPVNQLLLSAGDKLIVLAPGRFNESLTIMGRGDSHSPITISFAPGQYDFFADSAYKTKLNISNTNDTPDSLKAIALYFSHSNHLRLEATGAKIMIHGKMIETCINQSSDISLRGISFDYCRPTVSELKVISITDHSAELLIHKDSKYSIKDSLLTWKGEGWQVEPGWYWQVFEPNTWDVYRLSMDMKKIRFVQDGGQVRALFEQNPGFKVGLIYQNRDVTRDCAGIFMQRSKNIKLENIRIYFMHGMGVVSQFCENISMNDVVIKPDERSGRTCAAWADILHFSGCSGLIKVTNSYLSAANDDAINVHGTFLKIMQTVTPNQVIVRFMHDQTYGFNAFAAGDSIEFVHSATLMGFERNVVTDAKMLNKREILLTLKKMIAMEIKLGEVVENISATPRIWISNTVIATIPTRGVLITTRRKSIIQNCAFQHIHMSAVAVADDARSWFESGMVSDLTIRKNKFIDCGGPVIMFHPENDRFNGAVHKNIMINANLFMLNSTKLLESRNTSNVRLSGNKIITSAPVKLDDLISLTNSNHFKSIDNTMEIGSRNTSSLYLGTE